MKWILLIIILFMAIVNYNMLEHNRRDILIIRDNILDLKEKIEK